MMIDYEVEVGAGLVSYAMGGHANANLHGIVLVRALILIHRAGETRGVTTSLMLRYGLLYSGYRDPRYWWETVVLLRKYLLIMASLTMGEDSFQIQFALGVMIVMLHAHDVHRPYGMVKLKQEGSKVLHNFELLSILSLIFFLWCGVFFALEICQRLGKGWCAVMTVCIVGGNFAYMVVSTKCCAAWCRRNKCRSCSRRFHSLAVTLAYIACRRGWGKGKGSARWSM